jgi:phosphatidylglycerol:prolipoprotein diacylglycerol transferase
MLDGLVPSVPLAHAFGRLGCFFAGCCYGVPSAFGLEFNASELAPHGVKLLPVQLIEAGCNLLLFVLLLVLSRFCRRRGLLTGTYLAAYAVMRFVLEFFRYDAERGVFWGLSTSQWISLLLLPAAVFILCFAGRSRAKEALAENKE